jgi:P-type Ca2+ transporter type 2C
MQAAWHSKTHEEVLSLLESSSQGLLEDSIRTRRKQYGPNSIPKQKPPSLLRVAFRQFASPLMFVLIGAMVASVFIGEVKDAIVIGVALIMNAVVGFIQEVKAEKAAEALRSYEIKVTTVRRRGVIEEIHSDELVPGDIVILASGARVPADLRLLSVQSAQFDEALLTGESYPSEKNVGAMPEKTVLVERSNMAYMGTLLSSGKAEGIVVATGKRTRLGAIAALVHETLDEETPLQLQMKHFGRFLGALVLVVASVLFVFGLVMGESIREMFIISVALAVAAIPEGLLVALTVILAIGMQRMLKRKALVRRLVAAETLGSVTVVCTDKTGTLTEGHMTVSRVVTSKDDIGMTDRISDEAYDLLVASILNNDAVVQVGAPSVGHPTEIALVEAGQRANIDIQEKRKKFIRLNEVPFESSRKYMATIHGGKEHDRLIVKGAPEVVFEMCIDEQEKRRFREKADAMVSQGLRVLAVAVKDERDLDLSLQDLRCIGLIGIHDPLREQAEETISTLRHAGIRTIVITGDHPETVLHVAREAGMQTFREKLLIGSEIDSYDDSAFLNVINEIDIFARVEPHHKVRIVAALRKKGEVVAMIGDGVNDAAALKAADIGIAVGNASDVTKETSEMILLDSRLGTVSAAVREGRVIFDNMRKVIVYLMSDSFSEIVLVAGSLLLGVPIPITAAQILWINLVTDGFPYLALTLEPGEKDVMSQAPRKKGEPIMNRDMKLLVFIIGVVTDLGLFGLYLVLFHNSGVDFAHIQTIMFTALAMDSLLFVFAVRSFRTSIFRQNPFRNRWLVASVVIGASVQIMAIYFEPLQNLFGTVGLGLTDWLLILGLSVVKLIAIELTKDMLNYKYRKAQIRHVTNN